MESGHNPDDFQDSISRYLLGQLSPQERTWLEQEYFSNDDFFEEMLATESELTEAWLNAELPPQSRMDFEARFLRTPDGRQRLRNAATVQEILQQAAERQMADSPEKQVADSSEKQHLDLKRIVPQFSNGLSSLLSLPVIPHGVVALLLLGVAGNTFFLHSLRNQFRQSQQQMQSLSSVGPSELNSSTMPAGRAFAKNGISQLPSSAIRQTVSQEAILTGDSDTRAHVVAEMTLLPGLIRGGNSVNHLLRSAEDQMVRLHFSLPDRRYSQYKIVIQTVDGRTIYISPLTRPVNSHREQSVSITVPMSLLKADDYPIALHGLTEGKEETVEEYFLRVRETLLAQSGSGK
jgi:hypothetical protein